MAIDFPSSPTLNQQYTFAGKTWVWNGTGWEFKAVDIAVQSEFTVTASAGQTVFSLPIAAPAGPAILVTVDGVVQATNNYTLASDGLSIALAEAPGAGAIVRMLLLGYMPQETIVAADDTVTTIKLRDGAVTAEKLDSAYIPTTTATNKTLVNRESCTVTASGVTLTLPASPSPGWAVMVTTEGAFWDTIIARNGSKIMGLDEDMNFDALNATVELFYVDATRGWRII